MQRCATWGRRLQLPVWQPAAFFLWLSLKQIPIGTAYAVWTGIGSLGAFFRGRVCVRRYRLLDTLS
ncbi:SMR family transporter [Enterobacter cloacae complex sp. 288G10]|uniref:SMR family transporter n=1 Tax=Enterobacter cloacae complex sp. 288G10 TaxID=3395859 RepID=UPI003CFA55B8